MEKKTYEVGPGVAWVNGSPTPKDRNIELTVAEAQYDLSLGRIALVSTAPKAQAKAAD